MTKKIILLILQSLLLNACLFPQEVAPTQSVEEAVAAYLTSQPPIAPQPTYTPYPTQAPLTLDLNGLFCEYQFCIGHPPDVTMFDVRISNQGSATELSRYADGIVAAYRIPDYYNLVVWQPASGSDDPQFMLDIVMDANVDTRVGTLDVGLVGDQTTFYTAISNGSAIPSGGAAAWLCGDRAFGWKVYAESEELARKFFDEAITKFQCNQ